MILYYTDVDETLGPTYVVSQEKTADLPLWPTHRPRKKNTALYQLERPILAKAGDLLIFSMRTWHRASAITADQAAYAVFASLRSGRAAAHGFQGYHQWSQKGESPEMQNFIEHASPRQREVLGFPKPAGDAYWNDETLAAVKLRYPQMDTSPYSK